MIIRFNTSDVVPVIQAVNAVVNPKAPIQSLRNIKIDTVLSSTGKCRLFFTAGDGELWLCMEAPCVSVGGTESLCIDAKSLTSALKTLGDMEVEMSTDDDGNAVTFKYDGGEMKFPCDTSDTFTMPREGGGDTFNKTIICSKLEQAVRRVSFATADNILKPQLGGVRFDFLPDGMVTAATSESVVAIHKDLTVLHNGIDQEVHGFTLPKKACNVLKNILDGLDATCVVNFTDRAVTVTSSAFKMYSVLIEAKFPRYISVIPENGGDVALVETEAIMLSMKHVTPILSASSKAVDMIFTQDTITIACANFADGTSVKESVSCDYSGEERHVRLNGGTLLNLLSNISTETVAIHVRGEREPITVNESDAEKDDAYEYTSLMMPMVV